MNVKSALLLAGLFLFAEYGYPADYRLQSPDSRLEVVVSVDDHVSYYVHLDRQTLVSSSGVSMALSTGEELGAGHPRITKVSRTSVDTVYRSPFYKKSEVEERYNQIKLDFDGDYAIVFRAYDEGIAYRFELNRSSDVIVKNECAEFQVCGNPIVYACYSNGRGDSLAAQFANSNENTYVVKPLSEQNRNRIIMTPLSFACGPNRKVTITESNLNSYPAMYLQCGETGFKARFAPYPKATKQGGHNNIQCLVTETEDFIARTSGSRVFPWRVMIVTDQDARMLDSDLVYLLAEPSRLEDISWIQPGLVAWEWWNNWNITGVDFKAGINTSTYKHYIDFAAEYGIRYVILDEGWSVKGQADLLQIIPEIDLVEILAYAERKGVDIILWAGQYAIDRDMERIVSHYADLGVKGFKVDFCNRDDQQMVDFTYRLAETCARYGMVVDLHGIFRPAGLTRTYPNVLNFEAVAGLEQMKFKKKDFDMVLHDLHIPFIRMINGPMDYTQGAMRNSVAGEYVCSYNHPMSQGTRCRQLAQYIVYFSPLNMLCDSPTAYRKEPQITEFVTSIPVVWDQTLAMPSVLGENVVVARRSQKNWYIGAMNDWAEQTFTLTLDFLDDGLYDMELFRDGINADRDATDYRIDRRIVTRNDCLQVHCAPGGGFAVQLSKKQ